MGTTSHKRRWYQFSLKTLLVVMTVATVVFAWIGWRMQRARDNRAKVEATEEAEAATEDMGVTVNLVHSPRSRTWLERQFDDPGEPKPVRVLIEDDLNDSIAEHLTRLPNLYELRLRTRNIDTSLEHAAVLNSLVVLKLHGTQVTDAGLEHLKGLKNLEFLDLHNTKVTNAGLKHLYGLTNLECLRVDRTEVTNAGVNKLQQALPNCYIAH